MTNNISVYEFDQVFTVLADGSHSSHHGGVYAPEVCEDDGALYLEGWSTVTDGCSGQYLYSGPVMHSSEFIGDGLSDRVRETPGVYAVCAVYPLDGGDPGGWIIVRKDDDEGAS